VERSSQIDQRDGAEMEQHYKKIKIDQLLIDVLVLAGLVAVGGNEYD
jgi:hypothetical protein